MKYDIIGDIHGCAETLEMLLDKLGYALSSEKIYQHDSRKIIFLGDFIDRGPYQRKVISIVRAMIDSGSALSVMGNHEYNAITYATKDKETGRYLRPHSEKNLTQHQAFLDAFKGDDKAYQEVIDWFKSLPLWLDLGGCKVVHACWDSEFISKLSSSVLTDELLHSSSKKNLWQYAAIETLLKGKEIPLPEGQYFKDKDGHRRHEIRIRWWDQLATTYKEAFLGPKQAVTHIPNDKISGDHLIEYSHEEPPVFLGHYWMEGDPEPLASNIICLDYSVAKPGGKLVAYRWDGENELKKNKLVTVDRVE